MNKKLKKKWVDALRSGDYTTKEKWFCVAWTSTVLDIAA